MSKKILFSVILLITLGLAAGAVYYFTIPANEESIAVEEYQNEATAKPNPDLVIYRVDNNGSEIVFEEGITEDTTIDPMGSNAEVTRYNQTINVYKLKNEYGFLSDTILFASTDEKAIGANSITLLEKFSVGDDALTIFRIASKTTDWCGRVEDKEEIVVYLEHQDRLARVLREPIFIKSDLSCDAGWGEIRYNPTFSLLDVNNDGNLDIKIAGEKFHKSGVKEFVHQDNAWHVSNVFYWDDNENRFLSNLNPQVVEPGSLIVSITGERMLFHESVNGSYVGFAVDLAGVIAQRLGLNLKIVNPEKTSDTHESLLNEHKADLVISAQTLRNVQGKKSVEYAESPISYLGRSGSGARKYSDCENLKNTESFACIDKFLASLENQEIAILDNSASTVRGSKSNKLHIVDDYEDAIILFKAGKVDIVFGDEYILKFASKSLENIFIDRYFNQSEGYFIHLHEKNDSLQEILTRVLDEMKKEGVIDELRARWHLI